MTPRFNARQIEQTIVEQLAIVAAESGLPALADIGRDTLVFESGLDSLGFAILVAKLEDMLGFDPFAALAEPLYPSTVGAFIDVYTAHRQRPD